MILREEGGFWSGCLYRGIFPTILGIAPYVGLNFAVYETLKGQYRVVDSSLASVCVCVSVALSHSEGVVLSHRLDEDDHRDQLEVDNELPVKWKLCCGGLAGATAQSGKVSRERQSS